MSRRPEFVAEQRGKRQHGPSRTISHARSRRLLPWQRKMKDEDKLLPVWARPFESLTFDVLSSRSGLRANSLRVWIDDDTKGRAGGGGGAGGGGAPRLRVDEEGIVIKDFSTPFTMCGSVVAVLVLLAFTFVTVSLRSAASSTSPPR